MYEQRQSGSFTTIQTMFENSGTVATAPADSIFISDFFAFLQEDSDFSRLSFFGCGQRPR
jgi:hypothetical protein